MDSELYSPFQVKAGEIYIPKKYWEQLDGIHKISLENWDWIRGKLIASYWMNYWYDSNLPTPKTEFYTMEHLADLKISFKSAKFVRLNSLSPKIYKPIFTSDQAYKSIINSSRCLESIKFAESIDEEILVALREYIPLNGGNEYSFLKTV